MSKETGKISVTQLEQIPNGPEFLKRVTDSAEQAFLLNEAHQNQALWMEHTGVADKARQVVIDRRQENNSPDDFLADGTDDSSMYLKRTVTNRRGHRYEGVSVRFIKPYINEDNVETKLIDDVFVGYMKNGKAVPTGKFTPLEVQRLDDMVEGLEAQVNGMLPDLAPGTTHIVDSDHAHQTRQMLGEVIMKQQKRAD
jgi:hypothetical protein